VGEHERRLVQLLGDPRDGVVSPGAGDSEEEEGLLVGARLKSLHEFRYRLGGWSPAGSNGGVDAEGRSTVGRSSERGIGITHYTYRWRRETLERRADTESLVVPEFSFVYSIVYNGQW